MKTAAQPASKFKASWVKEEEEDYETPVDKDGFKTKVVYSTKADGKKVRFNI